MIVGVSPDVHHKSRPGAPPDFFAAEAAGLRWLAEAGAPVVEVIDVGPDHIDLRRLSHAAPDRSSARAFGAALAGTHAAGDRITEVGIVRVSTNLMMVCLSIKGLTEGWTDMPFAIMLEKQEDRRLAPHAPDGTMTMVLVILDRATKRTMAIRTLTLGRDVTNALLTLMEEQASAPTSYGRLDYETEVAAAYAAWPRPSDMVPAMCARETIKGGAVL